MSLNPGGSNSYSWRYSAKHEDRSLEIYGTIVALQEVQAREYNYGSNQPGRPAFWPDGNPKMNIRVGLATPEGQLKSLTFNKAGTKQISGEKLWPVEPSSSARAPYSRWISLSVTPSASAASM